VVFVGCLVLCFPVCFEWCLLLVFGFGFVLFIGNSVAFISRPPPLFVVCLVCFNSERFRVFLGVPLWCFCRFIRCGFVLRFCFVGMICLFSVFNLCFLVRVCCGLCLVLTSGLVFEFCFCVVLFISVLCLVVLCIYGYLVIVLL